MARRLYTSRPGRRRERAGSGNGRARRARRRPPASQDAEDGLEQRRQRRQVAAHGLPEDGVVDAEVLVHDDVAHAAHECATAPSGCASRITSGIQRTDSPMVMRLRTTASARARVGDELLVGHAVRVARRWRAPRRGCRARESASRESAAWPGARRTPGSRRPRRSEGTDGLLDDLVAHLRAQRAGRGEVDARVHDVGEEVEQAHEGEETDGASGSNSTRMSTSLCAVAWSRAVEPNTAMWRTWWVRSFSRLRFRRRSASRHVMGVSYRTRRGPPSPDRGRVSPATRRGPCADGRETPCRGSCRRPARTAARTAARSP